MKNNAFTLAEVLITLGIIGIIAALTLPTLIQKNNDKSTVTALKKFYTSISQAYLLAKNENGTPENWYNGTYFTGDPQGANILVDNLTKYLKTTKICHNDKDCFYNGLYRKIDGNYIGINWNEYGYVSKFITSDGMSVFIYSYGLTPQDLGSGMLKKSYAAISVDINGIKKPNMFGKDMFSFTLTENGIVPAGIQGGTIYDVESGETNDMFPKSCNISNCYGHCEGCAAWVIFNENLDYLHCNDLSWNGKTKCK